jgi:hypothetical protein
MSTTTLNMGMTKPALNELADVAVINTNMDLVDVHDHATNSRGVAVKRVASGLAAVRPAAVTAGQIYFATDTGRLSLDSGSTWTDVPGDATSDTLTNKTLSDPKVTGQVTIGTGVQSLPAVATNTGLWRYYKASTSAMTITPATGEALWAPGLTAASAANATYSSPAGESTGWYCNGTNWVCI